MKLHIIAALGLSLASGAVLAQTGALPSTPATDPQKENKEGTPTPPVDVKPNDDGTVGGTISGGVEGATGSVGATIDPEKQTGSASGKGSLTHPEFGKLDINKNGSLTRDEIRSDAKLVSQFNKMDTNGDGKVDRNEYQVSTRIKTKGETPDEAMTDKDDKSTKEKAKDKNQPGDVLPGG